jgi:hypothetical protein
MHVTSVTLPLLLLMLLAGARGAVLKNKRDMNCSCFVE